jgi:hypothetical protein
MKTPRAARRAGASAHLVGDGSPADCVTSGLSCIDTDYHLVDSKDGFKVAGLRWGYGLFKDVAAPQLGSHILAGGG